MQSKSEIEKLYCKLIDEQMNRIGPRYPTASTTMAGYFVPGRFFYKRMEMLARYRKLWGL